MAKRKEEALAKIQEEALAKKTGRGSTNKTWVLLKKETHKKIVFENVQKKLITAKNGQNGGCGG